MLPFSAGCASQSSVSVVENRLKKTKNEPEFMSEGIFSTGRKENRAKGSPLIWFQLPRRNFYAGLHRVTKGFKIVSSLFSIYRSDGEEEEEVKMEIGYPTDVRHVGHIGWEGFNNLDGIKSW
ncbi:hypothetical protein KSP39_PZI012405 [Platanthera zijinensis]|uniref:CRIB domain-containing protein n=1 Tax=Platanthera zijinensis TaxID=2320716 RepID=A0AAP0BHV6_9ASPA